MTQKTSTVTLYATVVAIGGFVFGFDAAVVGGIIGFVSRQMQLSPWEIGFLVSAPTLAAVVASFTVGFLSDHFGRKRILIFLAATYVASALLSVSANGFAGISDYWALVFARAIGGYAFGSLTQAPVYIAEIAPPRLRGRLVGFNQLAIVTGFSAAYFSNLGIQTWSGDGTLPMILGAGNEPWRWMLGAELVPAGIWLIGLFFIPESPRWLATKGRFELARQVLAKLLPDESVETTLKAMKAQLDDARAMSKTRFGLLLRPEIRMIFGIAIIVAIIQQITGINTVFFYATTIFELSGIGTNAAFSQTVWVGVTNVLFTLIALAAVDKWGRRPLFIVGLIGVSISFIVVSLGFLTAEYTLTAEDISALGHLLPAEALATLEGQVFSSDVAFEKAILEAIAPFVDDPAVVLQANRAALLGSAMEGQPMLILAGIISFVAFFALSLGPVMWIFLSEVFPAQIRGTAISLVTIFNSGTAFLVTFFFPIQVAAAGVASVFITYAAFAVLGLGFVVWLMPETKGLSLEELEEKLAGGSTDG